MLSIRTFARSAPRTLSRMAGSAAILRQAAVARPAGTYMLRAANTRNNTAAAASFSTTSARRAESDDELSTKLESEIQIEEEMEAAEQQPASIKDFLDNSPFELVDTPGQEVVKLVRKYGEEQITVSFSIADITNYDPFAEDQSAMEGDEGLEGDDQQSGKQSGRDEGAEDELDMDEETAAPINLSIVVEKPGKAPGALNIDATAQDGNIVVENMFFYEDAKVAKVDSPDAAQKRADVYPGPPFGSLDEDLQVLMERFLEERGVTQAMAVFVPDYVDVKEQREYLRWLGNVKGFIDA